MNIGDYVDDYCSVCKRSTDHSVAAMAGEEPVKTICRTCSSEHKYRRNKGGKQITAQQAWDKLLATAQGQLGIEPEKPKGKKK